MSWGGGGPHPPAPFPNSVGPFPTSGRGGEAVDVRGNGAASGESPPLSQHWERGPGGEGLPYSYPPLPLAFYLQPTLAAARALLGQILVRRFADGILVAARIVETEAYMVGDPACHAFRGRTRSNETMWGPPGRAYIHINYGLHHCLNAVAAPEGVPEAILLRAIEVAAPEAATSLWRRRFGADCAPPANPRALRPLVAGPGRLTRALGIDRTFDGSALTDPSGPVFLAIGTDVPDADVVTTTRIGITKGADLPWRFYVRSSPFVSRR